MSRSESSNNCFICQLKGEDGKKRKSELSLLLLAPLSHQDGCSVSRNACDKREGDCEQRKCFRNWEGEGVDSNKDSTKTDFGKHELMID